METSLFYDNKGILNKEESLVIDLREFVKEKKTKPSDRIIQELREQKKRNLENKKTFYPMDCIEMDICKVLKEKKRGKGRIKQFNKVIELIKRIQHDRGIIDFSRRFLRDILKENLNIPKSTRNDIIKEILKKAKIKDRVIQKKFLENNSHFEIKFKGEKTKSKIPKIDRIWKTRNKIERVYSFI